MVSVTWDNNQVSNDKVQCHVGHCLEVGIAGNDWCHNDSTIRFGILKQEWTVEELNNARHPSGSLDNVRGGQWRSFTIPDTKVAP